MQGKGKEKSIPRCMMHCFDDVAVENKITQVPMVNVHLINSCYAHAYCSLCKINSWR